MIATDLVNAVIQHVLTILCTSTAQKRVSKLTNQRLCLRPLYARLNVSAEMNSRRGFIHRTAIDAVKSIECGVSSDFKNNIFN